MRTKYALLAALLVAMFVGPTAARADFRTDNSWMVARPSLERTLVKWASFRGPETGYAYHHALRVQCLGDDSGDYAINRGRGLYHHFYFCLAILRDSCVEAMFQAWQIGPESTNYRITNLKLFRGTPVGTNC